MGCGGAPFFLSSVAVAAGVGGGPEIAGTLDGELASVTVKERERRGKKEKEKRKAEGGKAKQETLEQTVIGMRFWPALVVYCIPRLSIALSAIGGPVMNTLLRL